MLSTAQASGKVLAVYREPFKLGSPDVIEAWEPGLTVEQIVDRMKAKGLPQDFVECGGAVYVNGTNIPAVMWKYIKPKATSIEKPVAITFHMPIEGGRGGGIKRVFGLIAAIALSIVTAGIATAGIPALGIAAGSIGAKLLAAGVGLVGSLVINSLTSTPVRSSGAAQDDTGTNLEPASISGNLLQPNAPIPHVAGTRKIFPPFITEPVTEIIGQDEYVDGLYGLAGAHLLTGFKLGTAAIDESNIDADFVLRVYDGLPTSDVIEYPERYGRTFTLNTEMSVHGTTADDLSRFEPPLPVFHGMSTAESPDEAWLHMVIVGLARQSASGQKQRIPFRLRMRRRGDADWRYLPEVHYVDESQSQRRVQFKFKFQAYPGVGLLIPPVTRGFLDARKFVPAQDIPPSGADWESDPYFSAGAGNDIYRNGTQLTTNVRNISLEADTVTIYLDPASWTPGIYELEIKRGAVIQNNNWNTTTYEYSNDIYDLYGATSAGNLPMSREGILDRVVLTRFVSIKHLAPVNRKNMSLIYLRARNRTVDQLSCIASGYVRDWDGTGWNNVTTTSNPVPHYRAIHSGSLNLDPLPEILHDNDNLLEWRQRCIDNDYRCDLVFEGATVAEARRIVAACGFAAPFQSELWGVVQDYDRSAETPVQMFASRNTNNFKWRKAFPRLPAGLRVNFKSDEYEYTGKQIVVYRNDAPEIDALTEQIDYQGLVRRDDVIRRARFDLLQSQYRSTIYSWTAPLENIVCRRGSLIGYNHDTLQNHYGSARIDAVDIDENDQIKSIIIDETITIKNTADILATTDILAVADIFELGLQTTIGIRRTNGETSIHPLSNADGEVTDELKFETPVDDLIGIQSPYDQNPPKQIDLGCLVVVGTLGSEYKRLIVSDILPGKDFTAQLTALDEGQEIWSVL